MTALDRTDIPMTVQDGDLEVRTQSLTDTTTVAWFRCPPAPTCAPRWSDCRATCARARTSATCSRAGW
jgi:hypothetical protein